MDTAPGHSTVFRCIMLCLCSHHLEVSEMCHHPYTYKISYNVKYRINLLNTS